MEDGGNFKEVYGFMIILFFVIFIGAPILLLLVAFFWLQYKGWLHMVIVGFIVIGFIFLLIALTILLPLLKKKPKDGE